VHPAHTIRANNTAISLVFIPVLLSQITRILRHGANAGARSIKIADPYTTIKCHRVNKRPKIAAASMELGSLDDPPLTGFAVLWTPPESLAHASVPVL
jgi:hypothetical protein